jgi:hypothetical protein
MPKFVLGGVVYRTVFLKTHLWWGEKSNEGPTILWLASVSGIPLLINGKRAIVLTSIPVGKLFAAPISFGRPQPHVKKDTRNSLLYRIFRSNSGYSSCGVPVSLQGKKCISISYSQVIL